MFTRPANAVPTNLGPIASALVRCRRRRSDKHGPGLATKVLSFVRFHSYAIYVSDIPLSRLLYTTRFIAGALSRILDIGRTAALIAHHLSFSAFFQPCQRYPAFPLMRPRCTRPPLATLSQRRHLSSSTMHLWRTCGGSKSSSLVLAIRASTAASAYLSVCGMLTWSSTRRMLVSAGLGMKTGNSTLQHICHHGDHTHCFKLWAMTHKIYRGLHSTEWTRVETRGTHPPCIITNAKTDIWAARVTYLVRTCFCNEITHY